MNSEQKIANGRATSLLSSSTMIRLTVTLLAASSFGSSSALQATCVASNGAFARYATSTTDSYRCVKSSQTKARPHLASILNYRQGDQDDSERHKRDHRYATSRMYSQRFSRWWHSVCRGAELDDSTKHVDDYLEFLDRRYHRLHDKQTNKGVSFSALSWLSEKPSVTEDEQADALYVLGLAGLASDRFLERHRLSFPKAQKAAPTNAEVRQSSRVVVEAEVIECPADVVVRPPAVVNLPAEVFRKIGAGRQQLIAIQAQQSQAVLRLLMKTAISLPRNIFSAVWNFGGGKKTLTLTCWALVTAVVVIRPVVEALVKQKTIQG